MCCVCECGGILFAYKCFFVDVSNMCVEWCDLFIKVQDCIVALCVFAF